MHSASASVVPDAPVFATRSDPARSTRWSFERRTVEPPTGRLSSSSVKMQCEREEASFIDVADPPRLYAVFLPSNSSVSASSSERATCDAEAAHAHRRAILLLDDALHARQLGEAARAAGLALADDDARSSRSKPASL